jgi:hypothetical protein
MSFACILSLWREEKLRTLLASDKELSLKGRGVEVSERGTGSSVTGSEKNTLLQLHNDARNSVQPPADNMPQMVSFKLMMNTTQYMKNIGVGMLLERFW